MWWMYVILRPFFNKKAQGDKYKLQIEGAENVPERGPFMLFINHQTEVDFFLAALSMPGPLKYNKMVPWAKKEIGEGKEGFMGWILWRLSDKVVIDRNAANLEEAIRKSQDSLRKGDIIFIHPEGTRYPDGELGPFSWGAANLAGSLPHVPILPVAVWREYGPDGGMRVNIGKPFYLENKDIKQELLTQILKRIQEDIEPILDKRFQSLQEWASNLPNDKKGIDLLKKAVKKAVECYQNFDFEQVSRMAEQSASDTIREKVFELLPDYFVKVESPINK